jgi:hypothetical protein
VAARERALRGVVGDRRLVRCFDRADTNRSVELVVAITIDRGRLKSRIKQSTGSSAVIDTCVTRVFDQLAVTLPRTPLERPIEIPVRYVPPGA